MRPNWDYVKKTTLWPYEDLIIKLKAVTVYPLIWQAYNHDMRQAVDFARRLFRDRNLDAGEYPAAVIGTCERLQAAGVSDWGNLLAQVATRADCAAFITKHDLTFEKFIDVLNYLLRWAFPFQTATRELLEHDSPPEMSYYASLKRQRLMTNFDLLAHGRTPADRRALADLTGLTLESVTALVHRADIARLPYVRRKTILPICGAGYTTLAKIATAELVQMESDLEAYFRRAKGKSWANFKSVIVLKALITGAQSLPRIIDE